MAEQGDKPVPSIQFDDGIQSPKNQISAAVEGSSEKEWSHDLDEEERARKIAEQDLGQKKKQVGAPSTGPTLGSI